MSDTISRYGVSLKAGIPMPHPKHRFRVHFRGSYLFTQSIVSVDFDYVRKTITFVVREDPKGELHALIHGLRYGDIFQVEFLDGGSEEILRTMGFRGLELQEATCGLDYASAHPFAQRVTISYTDMQIIGGPLEN